MGKVDFRRLHELYSSDIKLTDELYYTPDEKEFFHSSPGINGEPMYCGTLKPGGVCYTCDYKPSKDEEYLLKLGSFNG
jgi:hypothetical protein